MECRVEEKFMCSKDFVVDGSVTYGTHQIPKQLRLDLVVDELRRSSRTLNDGDMSL